MLGLHPNMSFILVIVCVFEIFEVGKCGEKCSHEPWNECQINAELSLENNAFLVGFEIVSGVIAHCWRWFGHLALIAGY